MGLVLACSHVRVKLPEQYGLKTSIHIHGVSWLLSVGLALPTVIKT